MPMRNVRMKTHGTGIFINGWIGAEPSCNVRTGKDSAVQRLVRTPHTITTSTTIGTIIHSLKYKIWSSSAAIAPTMTSAGQNFDGMAFQNRPTKASRNKIAAVPARRVVTAPAGWLGSPAIGFVLTANGHSNWGVAAG